MLLFDFVVISRPPFGEEEGAGGGREGEKVSAAKKLSSTESKGVRIIIRRREKNMRMLSLIWMPVSLHYKPPDISIYPCQTVF